MIKTRISESIYIAHGAVAVLIGLLFGQVVHAQSVDLAYQWLGFRDEADYRRAAQICADTIGMPPIDVECTARGACIIDLMEVLSKDYSALISNDNWMQNKCDLWLFIQREAVSSLVQEAQTSRQYIVQVSNNDEFFIINDEKFAAKNYCFDLNVGDEVIFTEGEPNGICVSAEILNLRTRRPCRLWCE